MYEALIKEDQTDTVSVEKTMKLAFFEATADRFLHFHSPCFKFSDF